jgi:glycosyltransferase involved in cell wall biosynthesis
MIKLLIDGVFFQLNSTGIARVWSTILLDMANSKELDIYFLDRGNAPIIKGVTLIPFIKYTDSQTALDSREIQSVCDSYQIDIFTSTYYTSPLTTPMVMMVYDMIPELLNYDLSARPWMEKELTISYAFNYLCISNNTKQDLLALYPEIPEENTSMAYCGVDENVFSPRDEASIATFRKEYGLGKDYYILVGSRGEAGNYKNSHLFFDAIRDLKGDFDVLCVGGEKTIDDSVLSKLPAGVHCKQLRLTDDELALAYGGALALVYPSLYEGFGMPVVEAMAAGCPVITTNHGSLAEAAGDAAITLTGTCIAEMTSALQKVRSYEVRCDLKNMGIAHAKSFKWENMAKQLVTDVKQLHEDYSNYSEYKLFLQEWKQLRLLQAEVDELK